MKASINTLYEIHIGQNLNSKERLIIKQRTFIFHAEPSCISIIYLLWKSLETKLTMSLEFVLYIYFHVHITLVG